MKKLDIVNCFAGTSTRHSKEIINLFTNSLACLTLVSGTVLNDIVENEAGEVRMITAEDEWLYTNRIDEGGVWREK